MRLMSKLMLLYHACLLLFKLDIIRCLNFQPFGEPSEDAATDQRQRGDDSRSRPLYSTNPNLRHLYTKYYFYNKYVLKLNSDGWQTPRQLSTQSGTLNSYFDALLSELLTSRRFERTTRSSDVFRRDELIYELLKRRQIGRTHKRSFRTIDDRNSVGRSGNLSGASPPAARSPVGSGELSNAFSSGELSNAFSSGELSNAFSSGELSNAFRTRKILHYNKYLNIYNWTDHALDDSLEDYDDDVINGTAAAGPNTTAAVRPTVQSTAKTKEVKKDPLFPPDPFTMEQKRKGAVIFHILGVLYMFVALAVVCDEFFVPSLDVIIERLQVQEDVAGATFMAAGGSAPELFTSVIGVFVSFDDVGIGTIVGSAVFNILFVIGMCGLFSRSVLTLTWWPLFRDCSFYSLSLLILIYFFADNRIEFHEAAILFGIYIAYVTFMKFNRQMETWVKGTLLGGDRGEKKKVATSSDRLVPLGHQSAAQTLHEGSSITQSSSGTNPSQSMSAKNYRSCLVQLMVSTLDPLHDGVVDERAAQLTALASLKVILSADDNNNSSGGSKHNAQTSAGGKGNLGTEPNGVAYNVVQPMDILESPAEPLDMSWPESKTKQVAYVLLAPLLFPLWLTLPDTRSPRGKKFFVVTFIGSIFWIALYSYLMVWWADISGKVAKIPPEVMGFTFLAAGTSIPDLITSVIVARKGFGDMAVSSSVGSNIFDVTVGLPLPWLLYNLLYSEPVTVSSKGMLCSIIILFMMLLFVILSIASFSWKLHRGLGLTMFLLYFLFLVLSLSFEYGYLVCPY